MKVCSYSLLSDLVY